MAPTARRKTVFDADDNLLTQFQARLKLEKTGMNVVLEGWIRDFMAGTRALPDAPIPTAGTCPVCESEFRMTAKGAELVKVGPIEPLTPGAVPEEMLPLVLDFVSSYLSDPIFAATVNGIIHIHRASKKQ